MTTIPPEEPHVQKPQQAAYWLPPGRDFDFSVEIYRGGADVLDGVSVTFMPIGRDDGSAVLNIIWDAAANFDNSNTKDPDPDECDDLGWIEIATGGLRETTGLVRALVELGDRLKPLLKQLERGEPRRNDGAANDDA